MTVRTRIAPSPTGDPHVGTAYVSLFNWIWARKHGGQFLLRIEDTDQTRSTPESEAAIMRSLRWLGLEWDEGPDVGGPKGPYRQSERTELYREHAQQLIDRGYAYRCFCTPERLSAVRRERMAAGFNTGYDGHCRDLSVSESNRRKDAGESFTVRLKFPQSGETVVSDGLRGDVVIDNSQIDDQILLKSDGFPTYHLANVVDDHLMEITDVIRAEEWISSTPKHVFLYEAFGWSQPRFWHLPLLRNADKSKISKRKNPVSLDYYEQIGILPETMVNFLGLLGWSMPDESEKFTPEQMCDAFTFDRVSTTGPVFDLAKLEWLNGQYIRDLSAAELAARIQSIYLSPERLESIMPLVHERMPRLDSFIPSTSFFLGEQDNYDWTLLMPPKKRKFKGTPDDVRKALLAAAESLDSLRTWTPESVEGLMRELATELEWKAGHLFHPLRVATAGRTAAPPLFETMCTVGSAVTRARLRRAAQKLKGQQLPEA